MANVKCMGACIAQPVQFTRFVVSLTLVALVRIRQVLGGLVVVWVLVVRVLVWQVSVSNGFCPKFGPRQGAHPVVFHCLECCSMLPGVCFMSCDSTRVWTKQRCTWKYHTPAGTFPQKPLASSRVRVCLRSSFTVCDDCVWAWCVQAC